MSERQTASQQENAEHTQYEHILPDEDEETLIRRKEIERSIIKKYRREIWSRFTKAVRDYQLIQEGDRIAVCVSGGKDSFLTAKCMQELQKHGPVPFEAVYLCMDPGYAEPNRVKIEENAKLLGLPLTVFRSSIFDIVYDIDKSPCYLCARMRRGALYSNAKALGCNKIALGHHYDDVIETTLMAMLYGGKIETMMPKLHSQHFEGMELIRPLYLVREDDVKRWVKSGGLEFIRCACHFTEAVSCDTMSSKRQEVKQLLSQLRQTSPYIDANIFRSVENVNLSQIIGWRKDGKKGTFLDHYEDGQRDDQE